MPGGRNKQAKMVISPNQPQQQQQSASKKKKKNKNAQSVRAMLSPGSYQNLIGNGYKTALHSDLSATSLGGLIGESSGLRKKQMYDFSGKTGTSSVGISGASGNIYLDCLVDPSRGPNRLPDMYSKPTAIHQEYLYGMIKCGSSAASTPGAWTTVVNPFIGIAAPVTPQDLTLTGQYLDATSTWTASVAATDPDRATLASICNNIRPVGMSILLTYEGDPLTSGGQLAAALIPGNGMTTAYLSPTGQDLRLVSNLAIQPGAISGPLAKGAYMYWTPEDEADSFFYTLTQANAYSFPKIVISGTSTQSLINVLRYVVVVNYEYTTSSRLVTTLPSPIDPDSIVAAKKVLQTQPRGSTNEEHDDWWSRVLNGARDLFSTIGNGVYDLFHPSLRLASQAASDPGLMSAADKYLTYKGGAAGMLAAGLQ